MFEVYPLSKIKMHIQLLSIFIMLPHRRQRHIQNIWFWNITFVIICTPTLKGYFMQQKQWQRFKNCCFFFLKTGSQVDLELKNRHTHAHTQMCTHAHMRIHVHTQHTDVHTHTPLFLLTALKSFSLPFIFSLLILYTEMDIFYINSTWSLKIFL